MKKRSLILLLAVMMLTLVACGKTQESGKQESSAAESSVEESVQEPAVTIADALELLNTVWANYDDANKFPVGGGDSANLNFEGPGKFDAANSEELDVTLGFPADKVAQIDDAASMMNAMMANNFTAGVYHVTDKAAVQEIAAAMKENILARHWMCGMPEKMVIIAVDDYLISAFGLGELIDTFQTEIQEAYEIADVLFEESIS